MQKNERRKLFASIIGFSFIIAPGLGGRFFGEGFMFGMVDSWVVFFMILKFIDKPNADYYINRKFDLFFVIIPVMGYQYCVVPLWWSGDFDYFPLGVICGAGFCLMFYFIVKRIRWWD